MKIISGENVGENEEVGPLFCTHHTKKWDPLGPLLFGLDALSISISGAVRQGLVTGLASHLIEGGVDILQDADDTIMLL